MFLPISHSALVSINYGTSNLPVTPFGRYDKIKVTVQADLRTEYQYNVVDVLYGITGTSDFSRLAIQV